MRSLPSGRLAIGWILVVSGGLFLDIEAAGAQAPAGAARAQARAVKAEQAPDVDGRLDETV